MSKQQLLLLLSACTLLAQHPLQTKKEQQLQAQNNPV
jgi:outer membrane biogenesis lipoprotein LolB